MSPLAKSLANELGISNEHPDYPVCDWREAVIAWDTRDGYWDWVAKSMKYDNHAWLESVGF